MNNTLEIRAELSVKKLEFERARELGLPHSHLILIYRTIKELQYQLAMASLHEPQPAKRPGPADLIIE